MPSIWTIGIVGLIAALVLATLVRYFREQEYFARYEWRKQKIEEMRAKLDSPASEGGQSPN